MTTTETDMFHPAALFGDRGQSPGDQQRAIVSLTRAQLQSFHLRLPRRMVVAAAGNVNHICVSPRALRVPVGQGRQRCAAQGYRPGQRQRLTLVSPRRRTVACVAGHPAHPGAAGSIVGHLSVLHRAGGGLSSRSADPRAGLLSPALDLRRQRRFPVYAPANASPT